MRGTREPTHVRANLGDQHFRGPLLDTGDGAEQLKLLLERGHDLVDLQIEALDRFIEIINVRKELTHDDSVIAEEPSFECFPQGRNLGPQPALGELGQDLRVVRSSDQGLEHEPARDSQHLGCHRGQLDASVFQHLVQTLNLAASLLDQGLAIAGQVGWRMGLGGTKLGRTRPCSTSWQIQAASATSVLRPGTLWRCWALSSQHSKSSSRM